MPQSTPRPAARIAAASAAVILTVAACRADEDTVQVNWWGGTERDEITQEALAAFEEQSEVSVSGESVDEDGYFDRLATASAGGNAPEVFTLGGAYAGEYADRDALLDLETESEQLDLSGLDEAALENGQFDGVQYGLPTGSNAVALIVNPEIFEEAGVEQPDPQTWTWDDFAEISEQISENTDDDVYGTDAILDSTIIGVYARQQAETLYTEDGEIGVSDDSLEDLFTLAQDLTESGAAPPAAVVTELEGAAPEETLIATNRAAMSVEWSNNLATLASTADAGLEIWTLPEESEIPGVAPLSSQYWAISADAEDPEGAAELLNFLVNDEQAVETLSIDRGVPDNPQMREALEGTLGEHEQAEVDYIDEISSKDTAPDFIDPPGSTAVEDITVRTVNDLLHDGLSPEDAVDRWLKESLDAVEG